MKHLVLLSVISIAVTISGCAALPSFLGGSSKDIQAFLTAQAAGVYTVNITRNGSVLLSETWECTQSQGQLTGCHTQGKSSVPAQ